MKLLMVAIRDKQVDAFMPPLFVRAKGEAVRIFMDEVSRDGSPMAKHPGDYDLFVLAEYDDGTGKVVSDDSMPFRVMSGLEVKSAP